MRPISFLPPQVYPMQGDQQKSLLPLISLILLCLVLAACEADRAADEAEPVVIAAVAVDEPEEPAPDLESCDLLLSGPLDPANTEEDDDAVVDSPAESDTPAPVEDAGNISDLRWHLVRYNRPLIYDFERARFPVFQEEFAFGSHCFFATDHNRDTPILITLVHPAPDESHRFFLMAFNMELFELDLSEAHREGERLELEPTAFQCVFRPDQNEVGAVLYRVRSVDESGRSMGSSLIVFRVEYSRRSNEDDDKIVESRFLGRFPTAEEALDTIAEQIPRGAFQVTDDNRHDGSMWGSYFGGSQDFCPIGVECPGC